MHIFLLSSLLFLQLLTYTLFSVVTGLEPVVAIAFVRARLVDAISVLANVRVFSTLIDVPAFVRADLSVALRTDARKRPDQVLAREFTIVRRRHTLVNVYEERVILRVIFKFNVIIIIF